MSRSLGDIFRATRPHLSPLLVGDTSFCNILAIADQLPPAGISGFEIRLQGSNPNADIAVCWTLPHDPFLQGREPIAGFRSFGALGIPNMTLEYDTASPTFESSASPNMFVSTPPANPGRILTDVIPALKQAPLPANIAKPVRRCLDAAPDGPWVNIDGYRVYKGLFSVGNMAGRHRPGIRLCFHLPLWRDIETYLQRIDWPGNIGELEDQVKTFGCCAATYAVAADVGEQIVPHIGVELNLRPEGPRLDVSQRWETFLQRAIEHGNSSKVKCDALRRWPGTNILHERPCHITRFLHHAKITYRPSVEPELKAYLAVVPTVS